MTIIKFESISKTYRRHLFAPCPRPTLRDFSFTINQGDVIGIIGPNGAGKSTLIKALMGFIRIDKGSIIINGLTAGTAESRAGIGYLPETISLYRNLTVLDHLDFAAKLGNIKSKELSHRVEEVLSLVNLTQAAKQPLRTYSKGMCQRAALACALLTKPEILILDEPMSGLDPLGRQLIIDIIQNCKEQGTTILFCSHILNDVERICDRIGIMKLGKLALEITPEELDQRYADSTNHLTPLENCFHNVITMASENMLAN